MPPTLILGATGGFGGAVAQELLRRGEPVRALVRDAGRARRALGAHPALTLAPGDARSRAAVGRAAEGCRAIVHGVNDPYHDTPLDESLRLTVESYRREAPLTPG